MGIRVLAVSDVIDAGLAAGLSAGRSADVILACGDLPADYLGTLMNELNAPLVFVPGNHDPDQSGYRQSRTGLITRAGFPATARRLRRQARRRRLLDHRGVDVLLTHAPPRGVGDGDDAHHRGFSCYHGLIAGLAPAALLHGHVHPHGADAAARMVGRTTVCNVTSWRLLDLMPGSGLTELHGGYRHAV